MKKLRTASPSAEPVITHDIAEFVVHDETLDPGHLRSPEVWGQYSRSERFAPMAHGALLLASKDTISAEKAEGILMGVAFALEVMRQATEAYKADHEILVA